MLHVFFVSHQWTSFDHPDHTMMQLRTFQRLLTRMARGLCPHTAPGITDKVANGTNMSISTAKWKVIVQDAYIWLDFFSVRR